MSILGVEDSSDTKAHDILVKARKVDGVYEWLNSSQIQECGAKIECSHCQRQILGVRRAVLHSLSGLRLGSKKRKSYVKRSKSVNRFFSGTLYGKDPIKYNAYCSFNCSMRVLELKDISKSGSQKKLDLDILGRERNVQRKYWKKSKVIQPVKPSEPVEVAEPVKPVKERNVKRSSRWRNRNYLPQLF